ncbi:hypothetical protein G6F31_015803 [Rhizopus arrhizus]|nr:hypothetical protein G6F31_015803 [Rhizopus arrhizus]
MPGVDRAAPRRCVPAAPAPARRGHGSPTGCRPRPGAGDRSGTRPASGVPPATPGSRHRPASPRGVRSARRSGRGRHSCAAHAEACLESVVTEALADRAVGGHHHRALDQLRVLTQQQLPLGIRVGRLAVVRQLPPGSGGLVDHRRQAAQLRGPFQQGFRAGLVVAVVDEGVRHAEAVQPLGRLLAGIAVLQTVDSGAHGHL